MLLASSVPAVAMHIKPLEADIDRLPSTPDWSHYCPRIPDLHIATLVTMNTAQGTEIINMLSTFLFTCSQCQEIARFVNCSRLASPCVGIHGSGYAKCCSCRQTMSEDLMNKIQNEDAITGSKEQWHCKKCNALRSRIHRLHTSVDGFRDLSPDERAQFMLDNQTTFSQDLLKNMHEVAIQSRIRKSSSLFKKHGDYFDETDLRDKLRNKPDQLERILTSGQTLQCTDRGCTMYWLPNYSLEMAEEESKSESSKREIEATSVIKKAKKPKREPQAAEANGGDTGPDEKAKALVKLTEPQTQKLTKSKPLVEDVQFKLSQSLLASADPSCDGFVPPKMLEKGKEINDKLTEVVAAIDKYLVEKEAPKGDLAKHLKKASDTSTDAKHIIAKLTSFMKDADIKP